MPIPTTESPLTLNPLTLQVGGPLGWVNVSDAECSLLAAFAACASRRLPRAQILARVGKAASEKNQRALEVQIVRLRKKLQQAGATTPVIKSIRGSGYQLCVPVHINPPYSE